MAFLLSRAGAVLGRTPPPGGGIGQGAPVGGLDAAQRDGHRPLWPRCVVSQSPDGHHFVYGRRDSGAPGSETPGLSRAVTRGVPLMPTDVSAQAQPKFVPRVRRQGQGSGPAACIGHRRPQPEARLSPSAVTTAMMVTRPMGHALLR